MRQIICDEACRTNLANPFLNSLRILNHAGIEPAYLGAEEWCCGGAAFLAGCTEELEETVKHNIEQFTGRGIETLVTSCGGCYYYFRLFYPVFAKKLNLDSNFKVVHITEYVSDLIAKGKIKMRYPVNAKVTYRGPHQRGSA